MTAAVAPRDTVRLAPGPFTLGLAATAKIFAGTLVATNAAGYAVPASASSALKIWGRALTTVDNTSGANAALSIQVEPGTYFLTCSGASIASVGQMAYVVDDSTVSLSSGSGARPAAGRILFYQADTTAASFGQVAVEIGAPTLYDGSALLGGALEVSIAGVVTANVASLAAFAVGTNTDGLTHVEGNLVCLIAQTTAAQNGVYIVGTVAGGTAPLTRIGSLFTGDTAAAGSVRLSCAGGTVFANTDWKNTAAGTVGTDDLAFYPSRVVREAVLVAGTLAITNIPILSATKSFIGITRKVANTSTLTTGGYATNGAATPGVLGVATVTVFATVAAGTINVADVSTLEVVVINF